MNTAAEAFLSPQQGGVLGREKNSSPPIRSSDGWHPLGIPAKASHYLRAPRPDYELSLCVFLFQSEACFPSSSVGM